jgi:hypothetical protein
LLAAADRRLRLCERVAAAIEDRRDPSKVDHPTQDLIRERVFLIAQGYADANDANTLRDDPLLKMAVGREPAAKPLAGQSTLCRLENSVSEADLLRVGALLLEVFVTQCGAGGDPRRVVLDFDPFEDPAHGQQEGVLFNGYYDSHCYLPLYLCGSADGGRQYVIGALLRGGRAAPVRGARFLLRKVVAAIRERYPGVQIIVRGDGGFGVPAMIECCRRLEVNFCFGKPQNRRLHALSEQAQMRAALGYTLRRRREGPGAKPYRVYGEFQYRAEGWEQPERVVVKAEVTAGPDGAKLNPRFSVTDLGAEAGWNPRAVYRFYCDRGDPENRIKEFTQDLAADRLSCHSFLANQFRLLLHVAAYMLYQALQDALAVVAPGTEWAKAQVGTIRTRLLKVAARVLDRCRAVRVQMPSSYPWQMLWRKLLSALQPAAG